MWLLCVLIAGGITGDVPVLIRGVSVTVLLLVFGKSFGFGGMSFSEEGYAKDTRKKGKD